MLARACKTGLQSRVTSVLGAQWGDEGKGKLVDILAEKYDIVGRFNGGANAGHTLKVGKFKFAFHLLPCGMLYDHCMNVLGNGTVINIKGLFDEMK
jgi:adenylosuccinate synthase